MIANHWSGKINNKRTKKKKKIPPDLNKRLELLRCAWFKRLTDMQSKGRDRVKIKLELFVILCIRSFDMVSYCENDWLLDKKKKPLSRFDCSFNRIEWETRGFWIITFSSRSVQQSAPLSIMVMVHRNSQSAINWLTFCTIWARLFVRDTIKATENRLPQNMHINGSRTDEEHGHGNNSKC